DRGRHEDRRRKAENSESPGVARGIASQPGTHHFSRRPNCIRRIPTVPANCPARLVILPAVALSTVLFGRPRSALFQKSKFSHRNSREVDSRLSGVLKVVSFQNDQSALTKFGPRMLPRAALPHQQQDGGAANAAGLNQRLLCWPPAGIRERAGIRSCRCPKWELSVLLSPRTGEKAK